MAMLPSWSPMPGHLHLRSSSCESPSCRGLIKVPAKPLSQLCTSLSDWESIQGILAGVDNSSKNMLGHPGSLFVAFASTIIKPEIKRSGWPSTQSKTSKTKVNEHFYLHVSSPPCFQTGPLTSQSCGSLFPGGVNSNSTSSQYAKYIFFSNSWTSTNTSE